MMLRTCKLCSSLCIPIALSLALSLTLSLANPAQARTTKHTAAKSSLKTVAARMTTPSPTKKTPAAAAVPAETDAGTPFRYDSCGCSGG